MLDAVGGTNVKLPVQPLPLHIDVQNSIPVKFIF